jgi:molybdopterin converting factor subunit 1
MKLTVKLFAVAKQRVGRNEIEIEMPNPTTVGQLRSAIAEQFPLLADLLRHTRVAVNSDYAHDALALAPNCEIALIPPVSGG